MDIFSWLAVKFDQPILDWIIANLRNPVFDVLMPFITIFGDAGIFWIACAVVCIIIPKTRKMGLSMGVALLIGLLLCNLTLKPLIQRPRPYVFFEHISMYLTDGESDFSFPSGHTIASFEAAMAILLRKKKLGIPAMILAVLIAFSRLYLCVHYVTDVLASVVLGIGIALLATWLVNKGWELWEKKYKKPAPEVAE